MPPPSRRAAAPVAIQGNRQPQRTSTAAAQQSHGVVGHHAIRATAVGDDVDITGNRLQAIGELIDRDRTGTGDVAGRVLGGRADVEHDHVTRRDPLRELGLADLLQPGAVTEVGGGEVVEFGMVCGGHVPERRPQLHDTLRRQSVIDPCPLAAGGHQTRRRQGSQVERRVGDTLADLVGQLLDVALTLGEDIDQLSAPAVRHCLRDLGEPVEQRILRNPITHRPPPPPRHSIQTST